mmetsp:Transcript_64785/g.104857  ORF Transcript_64785/g.104857 Transcript_64785/m.104857 type:complete len:235 (+) Transcript_64785:1369-2073(+)
MTRCAAKMASFSTGVERIRRRRNARAACYRTKYFSIHHPVRDHISKQSRRFFARIQGDSACDRHGRFGGQTQSEHFIVPTRMHAVLHVFEEFLLGADDTARSADAQPGDDITRRKTQMFHHIQSNQSAGAPQTCQTMHGHQPFCRLRHLKESVDYRICWRAAVSKVQVVMYEPRVTKQFSIIFSRVEPHDISHIFGTKYFEIILWGLCEGAINEFHSISPWAFESDEFRGHYFV